MDELTILLWHRIREFAQSSPYIIKPQQIKTTFLRVENKMELNTTAGGWKQQGFAILKKKSTGKKAD